MASYDYRKIGFRFHETPNHGDYHRTPAIAAINDRYFLTLSIIDRNGWTFADLVLHDLEANTTKLLKRYDSNESRGWLVSKGAPAGARDGTGKYGDCALAVFGHHVFVSMTMRIDSQGTQVPHSYRETDLLKGRI